MKTTSIPPVEQFRRLLPGWLPEAEESSEDFELEFLWHNELGPKGWAIATVNPSGSFTYLIRISQPEYHGAAGDGHVKDGLPEDLLDGLARLFPVS